MKPLTADARLEAQICLILFKAGVTAPEVDPCLDWAFGPGAWYVPPREWVGRWNKRHPYFPVKRQESFVKFVAVVGFLFVQERRLRVAATRSN